MSDRAARDAGSEPAEQPEVSPSRTSGSADNRPTEQLPGPTGGAGAEARAAAGTWPEARAAAADTGAQGGAGVVDGGLAERAEAEGVAARPVTRPRPVAEPQLAAAEGASAFMVRVVTAIFERWPPVGRFAAFVVAVYGRYARHRGAVLAGGLAFFGMLSLVPSMLTLGALLALVVDPADFVPQLTQIVADHPEAADALIPVVDELTAISTRSATSVGLAGLVGLGFSLYAASRFVYVGRQVLDIAFELEPRPPSVFARAVSVVVTLLFQVSVLVGLSMLSVLPRILARLGLDNAYTSNSTFLRSLIAVPIVYLLLTLGMRYGIALRTVPWLNLGGVVGALLIVIGTWGLGWYLGVSVTYSQLIAVLGSVIALELWLYLIGLAIVLSAEIEALRLGHWHVRPAGSRTLGSHPADPTGNPARTL